MERKFVEPRILKIDERELSSRLSVPLGMDVDIAELYERILEVAKPAYVSERVKICADNSEVRIGAAVTESRAIAKLAEGCSEAVVFVATLGMGVERLLIKSSLSSCTDAFFMDAIADALVEALCDYAEDSLTKGKVSVGRFSPGYADLELSFGHEILRLCSAEKTLGIKLSATGMMIPRKSVNAIIMIKD